jgi:hypothetical protein
MNPFSNILNSPRTSIAGLLIGIVTIANVLSHQGITLGAAGSGSVISLVSGLAAALLGLLAKDPANSADPAHSTNSTSTAKLGALMLCALLITGTMPLTGCSEATVAQNIVNWTPALESAVAVVDSTASVLDPAAAPIFAAATVGFDAASNLLIVQAKAYLASPSAGVLAQLQTAVVNFQQQVNAALLQAAKITNPTSQQHVLNAINAVATVVTAMLALLQSVSSKAAVQRMAAQSSIKLATVRPYLDEQKTIATVAAHYNEPASIAALQVAEVRISAAQAGF